jgi:56kDa selenium binding protein (SBP56).
MPNVGDELHHFGWNACASCHGKRARRYLIIPGIVSGRIHIVDTATPEKPKLHKVIEPDEIVRKTKLTAPHTVHCLADGQIMISMLGDDKLMGPGGFLLLDEKFEVAGRWEADTRGMNYNYDFWYQPRQNVMVSSEWARRARRGRDSNSTMSRPGSTAITSMSGIGRSARSRRASTSAKREWSRSRSASTTIQTARTPTSAPRSRA